MAKIYYFHKNIGRPGIAYIIGPYNPSHNIYVVCVNFIHKWRNLQFKVESEKHISGKLFMVILFTLRVFARNLLRVNRRSRNS